jgi:hypothetical protein
MNFSLIKHLKLSILCLQVCFYLRKFIFFCDSKSYAFYLVLPTDEIFVSLRKQTEPVREPSLAEKRFGAQFKRLLETAVHCDVSFVLDNGNTHIPVHKAILTARSEYFEAMFSVGGMSESYLSEVAIDHNVASFRRMLEFIYTDEISAISNCSAEEILQLLLTAGQYCMDDLRIFAEPFAARLLSIDNIASFMLLSAEKDKSVLRDACIQFIAEHKHDLVADGDFYQEVESNPELGLLLFKYAINGDGPFSSFFSSQIADDQSRKRRRTEMLPVISSQPANGTITIAQSNASVHDLF